jgi:hypothetical protein
VCVTIAVCGTLGLFILLVLIIKLIKETRQRFGERGIRDGEIGKGRLEGEGVKELYFV